MSRPRLTDAQLAAIAFADLSEPASAIAERIDRDDATVDRARRRMRQAGGWLCPLVWTDCRVCGQPVCGGVIGARRTVHAACAHERNRDYRRLATPEKRRAMGEQSRRWVVAHPEQRREIDARRHAKRDAAMTPAEWAAYFDHLEAVAAADQERTRAEAWNAGQPWTDDEDALLIDNPRVAARDLALRLGRTLWAVKTRRGWLRDHGLLDAWPRSARDAIDER